MCVFNIYNNNAFLDSNIYVNYYLKKKVVLFKVNIMILTRVVVITITTAKRRSLLMTLNTSPEEQVSEQIR